MQMDALRQLGQGRGPFMRFMNCSIQAAVQVQRRRQLAVYRVVHNDVDDRAAAVHHGVELVPGTRAVVAAGHLAHRAVSGGGDHIAPGGGGDGLASARRATSPHNDLAADAQLSGQDSGAVGLLCFMERALIRLRRCSAVMRELLPVFPLSYTMTAPDGKCFCQSNPRSHLPP